MRRARRRCDEPGTRKALIRAAAVGIAVLLIAALACEALTALVLAHAFLELMRLLSSAQDL